MPNLLRGGRTDAARRHHPGETAMRMKIVIVLTAVVLMFAARTSAHHAFAAEFDASKPIKLRGTVVKMEWINPHTWIHLDVKTPKGTVERWMIEGGPPNALYRRGVTKDSLPNGVEILVEGFRAKDGLLKGNGRDLTFADGRRRSWVLPAPARRATAGTAARDAGARRRS